MDPLLLQNFSEGSITNKQKKKLPELSRKYFISCYFKKALYYYVRSMHNILVILEKHSLIVNPFASDLRNRM